jgi:hypothetical protein
MWALNWVNSFLALSGVTFGMGTTPLNFRASAQDQILCGGVVIAFAGISYYFVCLYTYSDHRLAGALLCTQG